MATGCSSLPDAPTNAGVVSARAPGNLLDLSSWKLQLPVGDPGAVTEVKQPELRTYVFPPFFQVDGAGRAVIFRAHAGGVTTANSNYPRTELREMTPGGADKAAWSTTAGTHTMTITEAINYLPPRSPTWSPARSTTARPTS